MAKLERNKDPFKEALMPPVFRVQLVREKSGQRTALGGPESAAQILGQYLQHADREHFVSLMLDVKNQVIGIHTVSVGSLFAAIVSPREVFKAAILANAAAMGEGALGGGFVCASAAALPSIAANKVARLT